MKYALCLAPLVLFATVVQATFVPAALPEGWRPDAALLLGMAAFAFLPRHIALYFLFALGFLGELFGSARFGLLTFCYLLAAWTVLGFERDLARGGTLGAWLAGIAGTAVAHGAYALAGAALGILPGFGSALGAAFDRTLAAALFGLACAWLAGGLFTRMNLLSPEAAEYRAQSSRRKGGLLSAWAR
ncbi:MAG: hypothetical protein KIS92_12795 [Planctomycetota bacterium]|nr:hypothetical protein [Planctomycetota bacterium]